MSVSQLKIWAKRYYRPELRRKTHLVYLDEDIMKKYYLKSSDLTSLYGENPARYRSRSIGSKDTYILPFNNYSSARKFINKISKNEPDKNDFSLLDLNEEDDSFKKTVGIISEEIPGLNLQYLKKYSSVGFTAKFSASLIIPNGVALNKRAEKLLEKDLDKLTYKLAEDLVFMKGSKSYKDHLDEKLTKAYKHGTKTKKSTEVSKAKIKPKSKKKTIALPRSVGISVSKKSLSSLLSIINSQLNATVASNMNDPHLNYRTGRFAGSVEATRITEGRSGMLTVYYTYMKYPYQTFEPGYKLGYLGKDPRLLISTSIRSIVEGLVTEKFRSVRE